jgi:hypothetical protein
MTAPAPDLSWIRSNPGDVLTSRSSVPASLAKLFGKGAQWRMLYEDWLHVHHQQVLPGFSQQEIQHIYDRISDPALAQTAADKEFLKLFESAYKPFHDTCAVIRNDMRRRTDALMKTGVKYEEATKTVGVQVAAQSVAKALPADGDVVRMALTGWAQIEAFKSEKLAAYNTAVKGFNHDVFKGKYQAKAIGILAESWGELNTQETILRDAVLEVGKKENPGEADAEKVRVALIGWGSAIRAACAALGSAAEQIDAWAEANVSRILRDPAAFTATYPVISGLFEACHVLSGTLGIVAGFVPKVNFAAGIVTLVDDVIDICGKRIIVLFASKSKDSKVKFTATEFQYSKEFENSKAGSAYLRYNEFKDSVGEYFEEKFDALLKTPKAIAETAKTKAKESAAGRKASELKAGAQNTVHDGLMRLREKAVRYAGTPENVDRLDSFVNALDGMFGTLQQVKDTDEPESDLLDQLKGLLNDLLEFMQVDLAMPDAKGLVADACAELFKSLAPKVAAAVGKFFAAALPFVNVALFVVSTGQSLVEYWAALNMELVTKEGVSDEERVMLQEFVARQVDGTHPLFSGLDFAQVQVEKIEADRMICVIAGVRGSMDRATLRFSPDDRTRMHDAVLAAARKNNPLGLHYLYTTLTPAWDQIQWGEENHGTVAATVTATIVGTGSEHEVRMTVLSDGAVTITSVTPPPPEPDVIAQQRRSNTKAPVFSMPDAPLGLTGIVIDLTADLTQLQPLEKSGN